MVTSRFGSSTTYGSPSEVSTEANSPAVSGSSGRKSSTVRAMSRGGSTEWRYPAGQFEGRSPGRVVPRLVNVAREAGFGESRLYEVLTAPMGLGGERRLVDLIREGRDEEVVEAVRSAAAG